MFLVLLVVIALSRTGSSDPVTGRRAPDRQLAFQIHHRDEAETGNIKQIWEMSRHHHITVLAAAWWLTQEERYAEVAAGQLRSWWSENPFLTGVHWTSGIEAGIRLISWTWARRLLDDWPKVGDLFEHNDDAVRQIAWHQEFLAAFPSRGSSANNHIVAEAAGRLVAACAFPWYARTAQWRRSAAALLERELAANTFEDGLNRELATDYHRFVLELGLVAAVEADADGRALSNATWELLARMLDAGAAILDVTGRAPRQGDGDEGRALMVDDPEGDPWATVLGTGAAVLGAPGWWPHFAGGLQAYLLSALAQAPQLPRPAIRPRRFNEGGLVVLRSSPQDGPEIWCRCDGGPHGFLSIAAHAHADALSLEVRHEGVDVLADPGTYCYHGEPEWRDWFRSTAAHNTLELAGANQSKSGGPFLWSTHPRTNTVICDVGDQPVQRWSAEHDGYLRLTTPATHRRSVTLDSPKRRLTVVDAVDTTAKIPLRLSWHFGPDILVELAGACARLSWTVRHREPAGNADASRGAHVDLPSGRGHADRRLVFAALRLSRSGDFPSRKGNRLLIGLPYHRTGVAVNNQPAVFRPPGLPGMRRAGRLPRHGRLSDTLMTRACERASTQCGTEARELDAKTPAPSTRGRRAERTTVLTSSLRAG